ncbi:hypothetical protein HR45_15255 [Shewanella mangrovi]|uniref:DUF4937 domain-containing protein n=1 Tax=Shewanella mangrovi TaxID=1515746 RepID=A0A094JW20_9GAMM|nr:DUF4937 domain-containing protein [Shewanella mangrovi]KFZ36651.1 hypothetical protein HR45_15255 [Shewanella mangrovi]
MTVLKLIRCIVPREHRQAFSAAQNIWQALAPIEGFAGQAGGWEAVSAHAVIFGYWLSVEALQQFMDTEHDSFLKKNTDIQSFSECQVSLYEQVLAVPAMSPSDDQSRVIRTVFCNGVKDERQFIRDQLAMWNPALATQNGMLGGYIWRNRLRSRDFILQTYWESKQAHTRYLEDLLPELMQAMRPMRYMQSISGSYVLEEPLWRVNPQHRHYAGVPE